jgi:ABC-type dipeptide/oligopeptide/nickel transport system permease component
MEATAFAFVLEWSFRLPGVGPRTVQALRVGDLYWLMAVCLSLGVTAALTQIIADGVIGSPRGRRGVA